MRRAIGLSFCSVLTSFILIATVCAGGWDLVTVKDFPDFAVAGKPLKLTFKVFVPSLEPFEYLQPGVRATFCKSPCKEPHSSQSPNHSHAAEPVIEALAKASTATNEYTATLILPRPGEWVIAVDTEYKGAATLPPLRVIAPGAEAPTPLLPATQGLRLFTVKGCNGCHLHEGVDNGRLYGPDLTGKRFEAKSLRKFLADPSLTPVPEMVCSKDGFYCGSPYAMPNLNLTKTEIDALVAFINRK